MTCPFSHWLFLPRELRSRLRGLSHHQFRGERMNHLYDTVRCKTCRKEQGDCPQSMHAYAEMGDGTYRRIYCARCGFVLREWRATPPFLQPTSGRSRRWKPTRR